MNRLLSFACSLFFFVQAAIAQQAISTAGETVKTDGTEVSWTIGEPVISTCSGNSFYLTQGFQQPGFVVTEIKDGWLSVLNLKVYPNPVANNIFVQLEPVPGENFTFTLFNIKNQIIQKGKLEKSLQQIEISGLAPGTYLLKIESGNETLRAFKVLKIR